MNNYADVLSFGGGVNSAALAIMAVNDGWRGEIVFSDTGCENPETYCWINYFEREWLMKWDMSIVRLSGLPYQRKSGGRALIEYCESARVIPLAAVRWCTIEWKINPIMLYCADRSQMLGIAADERHRRPDAIRPLVEANITRQGCIKIIEMAGLDVPQKSGCYICPFQRNSQWRALWERHPDLFERAAQLEENVTRRTAGRTTVTLDLSGKFTLRQRELSYRLQMELPELDMDGLLQYQPCVCTV